MDAADVVNLLVSLYGLAKGASRGEAEAERLEAVAELLKGIHEELRRVDNSLQSLRQEVGRSLQAELKKVKTLVEGMSEKLDAVIEERLTRIIYIVPGFELKPLVPLDVGVVASPVFQLNPLPSVELEAPPPSLEVRGRGSAAERG